MPITNQLRFFIMFCLLADDDEELASTVWADAMLLQRKNAKEKPRAPLSAETLNELKTELRESFALSKSIQDIKDCVINVLCYEAKLSSTDFNSLCYDIMSKAKTNCQGFLPVKPTQFFYQLSFSDQLKFFAAVLMVRLELFEEFATLWAQCFAQEKAEVLPAVTTFFTQPPENEVIISPSFAKENNSILFNDNRL